jgi:hypothetical protein
LCGSRFGPARRSKHDECVEVDLRRVYRRVVRAPVGLTEELVLQPAVEALDHPVRLGRSDPGRSVLELLYHAVELEGVVQWAGTVLPAVFRQDTLERHALRVVEGQYTSVKQVDERSRQLAQVELGERHGAARVDEVLGADAPDSSSVPTKRESMQPREPGYGASSCFCGLSVSRWRRASSCLTCSVSGPPPALSGHPKSGH